MQGCISIQSSTLYVKSAPTYVQIQGKKNRPWRGGFSEVTDEEITSVPQET